MKLSFKKHPKETGLSAIGNPFPLVDIRFDKKKFGLIYPPTWNSENKGWIIKIMVVKRDIKEDGNLNCEWKWKRVPTEFETEENARNYMIENKEVFEKMNLYFEED